MVKKNIAAGLPYVTRVAGRCCMRTTGQPRGFRWPRIRAALLSSMISLTACGTTPSTPGAASASAPASPASSASPALPAPPSSAPPRLLLLGEVHDNPDGHRQRFEYLRPLIEAGWRPAIVMEQFDREQQSELTRAQQQCADADCVVRIAGRGRWAWPLYRPLIELALRHRLPMVAGNLSRADAGSVMRSGLSAALDADTISVFGLRQALPPQVHAAQKSALEQGHCGRMPEAMAAPMVNAQVARDVWMAQALRRNADRGAVLIAGNGHVRRDIGVPYWLSVAGVGGVQVHGFVEGDAAERASAYDVVRRIAPHKRDDPCAGLVMPARPAG